MDDGGTAAHLGTQISGAVYDIAVDAGCVSGPASGAALTAVAGFGGRQVILLHGRREAAIEPAEDAFTDKHPVASGEVPVRGACGR